MNLLSTVQKVFTLIILASLTACSYLGEELSQNPNLILEETADYILLTSENTDNSKAGILFYPGGLVDPHAYITALQAIALEDERTVLIVKVASNLAILNSQKGSYLVEEIPTVSKWVVGGHSLGGAVCGIDVANNPDTYDAMFLLAAYSSSDISDTNIPVLSITASKDEVLDQVNFDENVVNLPEGLSVSSPNEIPTEGTSNQTIYYEIEGGNHAQFGGYGEQSGDGVASIDSDLQHALVVDALRQFLLSNNL